MRKLRNGDIQREQLKLVQIQREIEDILGKVNENLNSLKVEELQLRSVMVTNVTKVAHSKNNNADTNTNSRDNADETTVNSQYIDLNTHNNLVQNQIEEEDEDE